MVSVTTDRGSSQRPRSGDSRKDSSYRGGNAESTSGQQSRMEGRQEGAGGGQQASGPRQESSRQTSEDMSWEFTINEAPIARLESLDELDQDHGS